MVYVEVLRIICVRWSQMLNTARTFWKSIDALWRCVQKSPRRPCIYYAMPLVVLAQKLIRFWSGTEKSNIHATKNWACLGIYTLPSPLAILLLNSKWWFLFLCVYLYIMAVAVLLLLPLYHSNYRGCTLHFLIVWQNINIIIIIYLIFILFWGVVCDLINILPPFLLAFIEELG